MANVIEVTVPDIGDASDVDVIEVCVQAGAKINPEDALIVLETDKATMDVPAPGAGVVKEVKVAVGDKVSQGSLILLLEEARAAEASEQKTETATESSSSTTESSSSSAKDSSSKAEGSVQDVVVPDIGDVDQVDVIELCVKPGDSVEKETALVVVESDKATMEIPAPEAGEVKSLEVKVGDKVSQGSLIAKLLTATGEASTDKAEPAKQEAADSDKQEPQQQSSKSAEKTSTPKPAEQASVTPSGKAHASPSIRKFARELGVDLAKVSGTGNKGRVTKADVQTFVKSVVAGGSATASSDTSTLPFPEIDHSKFGEIEETKLKRIQKLSAANLQRNWSAIPHVTQHENADVTELEAFRKSLKAEAEQQGVRLTSLAFIMKAVAYSLKAFPKFNSSLANDGETLILKQYVHIGVAVDTPDGLVVPVIRDVDQKSVYDLAKELGEISARARDKKLKSDEMQGSSFTISSLGGIGGTAFTPIVNWPNVAILGLSRHGMQPVWNGKEFEPRLLLPMSISYDHRVIDGAVAARFAVHLSKTLGDFRRVVL